MGAGSSVNQCAKSYSFGPKHASAKQVGVKQAKDVSPTNYEKTTRRNATVFEGSKEFATKFIEVSFVDKKTGKIYPEEKIIQISNEVCRQFDYPITYYRAYKPDKHGNNPYDTYARELSDYANRI